MFQKNTYVAVGLGLVVSWLFVAVSYYLSERTAIDWFSRSGAVMCLISAVANFVLVRIHQSELAKVFRDQQHSAREKAEAILKPSAPYTRISRFSYVTAVLGTAIWGYGDLLL